jgi:N-acyl-D-aspartate/D-glutamate deacylase
VGKRNWGAGLERAIETVERLRGEGLDVSVDVYPWTAGSSQLVQLLPPAFLDGGLEKTAQRLKDREARKECRAILESDTADFDNQIALIGWENVMISSVRTRENSRFVGKRLSEAAALTGKDPFDAFFDLLAEENCEVSMVNFIVSEKDIDRVITLPYSLVISDSIYPPGGLPHPRQYGTFTKYLSEYVRDRKILSLEEAVRKITGGPAGRFGIKNKGLLREGFDADIAVFDLEKIENSADYLHPREFGKGFARVFVNGKAVCENDRYLGGKGGRVLRRSN